MKGDRRKKPLAVSEALASYLEESGLGEKIEQAHAVDEWTDRVGEKIAAVTEPLNVRDGVLFVGVTSSAWLMELRMMEADIRRRLNEGRTEGRMKKIRFVMEDETETERRRPGWGRRKRE